MILYTITNNNTSTITDWLLYITNVINEKGILFQYMCCVLNERIYRLRERERRRETERERQRERQRERDGERNLLLHT